MKTGAKIGISIGAIATIVGGYFLWSKVIKPKRDEKKNEEKKPPSEVSNNIANASTSSSSGGGSSANEAKVPFKNREEGNHFRNWVNDTYPAYAAALKGDGLDRDGAYNNSHTRTAWKDKGAEYQKAVKDAKTTATAAANAIITLCKKTHLQQKELHTKETRLIII